MLIFFFASTAASSAYFTASEVFPLETRARDRNLLCHRHRGGRHRGADGLGLVVGGSYAFAALLMLVAAAIEAKFGVDAEMRSLEEIADPLSVG